LRAVSSAVDEVRDEMYPMLPLPPEWQKLEDGTPAPNWVAAVALSRCCARSSRPSTTRWCWPRSIGLRIWLCRAGLCQLTVPVCNLHRFLLRFVSEVSLRRGMK
jgi:hypothetical protein